MKFFDWSCRAVTLIVVVALVFRFVEEEPPRSFTFFELCASVFLVVIIAAALMYVDKRLSRRSDSDDDADRIT